eukprot:20690-Heterococcus_DN1.PRE.1
MSWHTLKRTALSLAAALLSRCSRTKEARSGSAVPGAAAALAVRAMKATSRSTAGSRLKTSSTLSRQEKNSGTRVALCRAISCRTAAAQRAWFAVLLW